MDVFEAIRKRRSIRKYLDKDVPDELIKKILDAARWAPSAKNSQPWEFIIVKDKEKIRKFAEIKKQEWIKTAPVLIFVVANPRVHKIYYAIDCARATQNACLAAFALGLGTCIINCYELSEVKKMLNIPDDLILVEAFSLGWPAESPTKSRKPLEDIVYEEEYGKKWIK